MESCTLIAIVWGFGNLMGNSQNEADFYKLIKTYLPKELESISLYDLWINTEELLGVYLAKPSLPIPQENNKLIITKDLGRTELLVDMLLTQNEHFAIIGPNGAGKFTLANHLLNINESKITQGFVYCSPTLSVNCLKEYMDKFYITKKNHIATPLTWKPVVLYVEDLHMTYPSNMQIAEFIRFWMDWKGCYDIKTYSYKSITNFSLLYTVEDSVLMNSVHLKRVLSGVPKIHLSEPEGIQQSLFIDNWIDNSLVKVKIVNVLKDITSNLSISVRLLNKLCLSLNQINIKENQGLILNSELTHFLVDRIYNETEKKNVLEIVNKGIQKEFGEIPLIELLGNYHEINNDLIPSHYSISEIRNLLKKENLPFISYLLFDVFLP